MVKKRKLMLPALLATVAFFMAGCESPVHENNGTDFNGNLSLSQSVLGRNEEVKDTPQLEWGPVSVNPLQPWTGKDMIGVAFGNGIFVAGGREGKIARSTNNGIYWADAAYNGGWGTSDGKYDNVINAIAYGVDYDGYGVFVAVGDSNAASGIPYIKIAYSLNSGNTWTGIAASTASGSPLPVTTDVFFRAVTYGHTPGGAPVFVAGGSSNLLASGGGKMMYSLSMGQTWINSPSADAILDQADVQAIAYGEPNGVPTFVAVGGNAGSHTVSAYSIDGGATWFPANVGIFCKGLIYSTDLGGFVGSGQGGYVTVSSTGQGGWNAVNTGMPTFLNTIAYGQGSSFKYYVTGSQYAIYYKGDLRSASLNPLGNYSASSGPISQWVNHIAFGNGNFVAVGDDGTGWICTPQ
jgi:hypothetical protein